MEVCLLVLPSWKCVFLFCPIVVCDWWGIEEDLISRWVLDRSTTWVVIKWIDHKLVCLLWGLWIDTIIVDLSLAWYAPRVWELLWTRLTIFACCVWSLVFFIVYTLPALFKSYQVSQHVIRHLKFRLTKILIGTRAGIMFCFWVRSWDDYFWSWERKRVSTEKLFELR